MNRKTTRRMIRWLGLALAVAAFAAPAAQAMPYISDEGSVSAAPRVLYPDDLHATVPHPAVLSLTYPDDLVRPYASESHNTVLTDGLGRPIPPEVIPPTSDFVTASDSGGFDWRYAGIGATIGFALILMGLGALFVERHHRKSRLAAA